MIFGIFVKLIYCVENIHMFSLVDREQTNLVCFIHAKCKDDYSLTLNIKSAINRNFLGLKRRYDSDKDLLIQKIEKALGPIVFDKNEYSIYSTDYKNLTKNVEKIDLNLKYKEKEKMEPIKLSLNPENLKKNSHFSMKDSRLLLNFLDACLFEQLDKLKQFSQAVLEATKEYNDKGVRSKIFLCHDDVMKLIKEIKDTISKNNRWLGAYSAYKNMGPGIVDNEIGEMANKIRLFMFELDEFKEKISNCELSFKYICVPIIKKEKVCHFNDIEKKVQARHIPGIDAEYALLILIGLVIIGPLSYFYFNK